MRAYCIPTKAQSRRETGISKFIIRIIINFHWIRMHRYLIVQVGIAVIVTVRYGSYHVGITVRKVLISNWALDACGCKRQNVKRRRKRERELKLR